MAKGKGGRRPGMTKAERDEETQKMLRMRMYGASYEAIARTFDLATPTVWERINKAIEAVPTDDARNLRALEAMKLDHAETKIQDGVGNGDLKAIDMLVKISESRRRLLGLNLPEQHEVKISREEESLIDQLVNALTEEQNHQRREQEEG